MLQTHGTLFFFFQRGTRSLSWAWAEVLNCQNSRLKKNNKKKKTALFKDAGEKNRKNSQRDCRSSNAPWIDNEHPSDVLKAFVPHMRRNSSEMTSTHILAVLIWQAKLWCLSPVESPGRFCCNKPQHPARWHTLTSRKSAALWAAWTQTDTGCASTDVEKKTQLRCFH